MPFVRVFIHFVWSTKNREPYLDTPELRKQVWVHIKDNAKGKDIYIDHISGHQDHCHCLISIGVDQTIKEVMQLIKGESSFWINKEKLIIPKFHWQNDYFAVGVSESLLDKVRIYIQNQEQHHRKRTFQEEYEEFITKYGFKRFTDE